MKKPNTYRKIVNQNTIVIVIVALLFLGFGSLRIALEQGVANIIEGCPKITAEEADGGWGESDCTAFWHQLDIAEKNAVRNDALLCYTVTVLLLTASVVYRRQALAKE